MAKGFRSRRARLSSCAKMPSMDLKLRPGRPMIWASRSARNSLCEAGLITSDISQYRWNRRGGKVSESQREDFKLSYRTPLSVPLISRENGPVMRKIPRQRALDRTLGNQWPWQRYFSIPGNGGCLEKSFKKRVDWSVNSWQHGFVS